MEWTFNSKQSRDARSPARPRTTKHTNPDFVIVKCTILFIPTLVTLVGPQL